jgi:hypothetical protein
MSASAKVLQVLLLLFNVVAFALGVVVVVLGAHGYSTANNQNSLGKLDDGTRR